MDKNLLQNYHPVSNLPFLSKHIQRAVAKQMDDHLTSNALLDPFESFTGNTILPKHHC